MYLQADIDGALRGIGDQIIANPDLTHHVQLFDGVLSPFNVKVRRGFNRAVKNPVVYGYYEFMADEAYVVMKKQRGHEVTPITKETLPNYLFNISCTAQHELLHKYQWLHRDPDLYESRVYTFKTNNKHHQYLGNLDEIETHAHDLAMEIKFFYPTHDPYEVLHGYFRYARKYNKLSSLNFYASVYGMTSGNPVMKRFLKKTTLWLNSVEVNLS